ncbi:porin family protein [Catenovulum sp. 2E275]|uniref:porin family protein n=1 Tax=Catenovulum sp. 2E275 TaxID=2980497 RepID=UPI0021D1BFB8|nr:porin family protein [Catenovulum sp. 2E275]MCU4674704.1 porin family protein [Catenovulum sp. 2E275]
MKKQYLMTMFAGSSLLLSGLAHADSSTGVDHNGLYVGAGYGLLKVKGDDEFDDEDNAVNVFAGLQFNQILSIEGGYIDFGEYGNDVFNSSVDGYTLALKAGIPLHERITLYAKGGQLWWQSDLSNTNDSEDVDGQDLFYGVGASFALTESWDLNLEYTRFDLEFERDEIGIFAEIDDLDTEVDYAGISLSYTF